MPRRIYGQKKEGVYPMAPRDLVTPKVFNKVRHWPLRPEFDRTNDTKIFKTFHMEFVEDHPQFSNDLCAPRRGYTYKTPARLRCGKGDKPVSRCGLTDLEYVQPKINKTKLVSKPKHKPIEKFQMTRKKKTAPPKTSTHKKSIGRRSVYSNASLKGDYDDLAMLAY